jgi:hypothetical protein
MLEIIDGSAVIGSFGDISDLQIFFTPPDLMSSSTDFNWDWFKAQTICRFGWPWPWGYGRCRSANSARAAFGILAGIGGWSGRVKRTAREALS